MNTDYKTSCYCLSSTGGNSLEFLPRGAQRSVQSESRWTLSQTDYNPLESQVYECIETAYEFVCAYPLVYFISSQRLGGGGNSHSVCPTHYIRRAELV